MNRVAKFMACAAVVAMAVPTAASAQFRNRDRGGIDAGEIIAGVAVIGGIAAIASALSRDRGRYGRYGNDYGYSSRNYYVSAVNACASYADRYGGRVRISDVDRRSSNRYRVRGVIENGYGGGGGYGGYDRYDRYGSYGYGGRGYYGNQAFACTATDYGRITDFDLNGRNRW